MSSNRKSLGFSTSTASLAVQTDTMQPEMLTCRQIVATVRTCLKYKDSGTNDFNRLLNMLETTNFLNILHELTDEELETLLPMLAQHLSRLRLEMRGIPRLYSLCRKMGVAQLLQVRSCDVTQNQWKAEVASDYTSDSGNGDLLLLGKLLPRLELLNVHTVVVPPFPKTLPNLRALLLRQGTSQMLLDQICANCPQLQQLLLRNESATQLDVANILKCSKLREVQLPLMLRSSLAIGHLGNLEHLFLQRLQLWPGADWVPIVRDIVNAKRYELRMLSFDGSWMVGPLDLSQLQLNYCWGLEEVLLSNCKLADWSPQQEFPLSCQRFSLRGCRLSRLLRFLRNNAQLMLLELFNCQLSCGEQLLNYLVKQRQSLPAIKPLQVRFSQSTSLRMELNNWTHQKRRQNEQWLRVEELDEHLPTWRQPIGTICMKFGKPINHMPDLSI